MAINNLVSIKVPVLHALEDMGIDISKDVPVFTRWAVDAEKNGIGSYYSYKRKRHVLTMKDCRAKLPCDAATVQVALLGDHGCDCEDLFNSCLASAPFIATSAQDTFLVIDNADSNAPTVSGVKWEVTQGYLVLKSNQDGQKVTIQYLGFELDEDGFPKVVSGHVMAIVEYIMYKYAVRSRFSPVKMDHTDVRRHWLEWMRLASSARADDAELSETDRMEIIAMIHDPWIGYGMEVGMFGRNDY